MTVYETLRVEPREGVTVLTLNRPARRNALNPIMFDELAAALASVVADPATRAVVLHGADGHFCAGADVREGLRPRSPDAALQPPPGKRPDPYTALHDYPIPTFAAVEGAAIGIGLSLALVCDIVVVASGARLQLAQVALGLVPDGGVNWVLPRLVGPQRAAWLALSGAAMTGREAAAFGLAFESVDDGSALARVLELAQQVARAPRSVLERVKRVLRAGAQGSWGESFAAERDALAEAYRTPEFAAAVERLQRGRP